MPTLRRTSRLALTAFMIAVASTVSAQDRQCRQISADVVAFDHAFYNNRFGTLQQGGMMFALRRDVVPVGGSGELRPGYVTLRPGKRPRPMVLRMNVGDCLTVHFTNLLKPTPIGPLGTRLSQPGTRAAGVHVMGMEPIAPDGDGSWAGANASSLIPPGASTTYGFYAEAEGAYLLYSTAADVGTQWNYGGQLSQGLFGSVTVQPQGAEWYRSQVTRVEMQQASTGTTASGQPIINYAATAADGTPILAMLNQQNEIVHTDLTAVITGPSAGAFTASGPSFDDNPAYPNRRQPFREFAIHYHDDFVATQAFPEFSLGNPSGLFNTLAPGRDMFAINYGIGGIGAEVWANRLGVGPSADCDTCKFEEFFLSSWATGDPAMVVDVPANAANKATGKKATKALFPDDPSNVYHSYIGDHVKFRILHAGSNITHVHHQHAHQWLHTPNSDESDYRDSQMISPGGAYTLDQVYNGSGNKNQTVGDSIFHCHFYPHFAQGMWALWRTHDVFESGTRLGADGRVAYGDWNRALPDGEIAWGTPIPAVVPLPTLPMAPVPAQTRICPVFGPKDTVVFSAESCPTDPTITKATGYKGLVKQSDVTAGLNPGFPFFVPGVGGKRAPHPPLDFAWEEVGDEDGGSSGQPKLDVNGKKILLDGGLPRNLVLMDTGKYQKGSGFYEKHNKWDFSKDNGKLVAVELDSEGTNVEKVAMQAHAVRCLSSFAPDGSAKNCSGTPGKGGYILNGLGPVPGAPYANPGVDLDGNAVTGAVRRYKAAAFETNVVLNKKGWHYPQQRMLALWGDVENVLNGSARPEPLFFRASSTEIVEYWHTNLVPNYYELDDFQVRTPTDILGQHIHLVKFDVTSSDGAGNGFNYEDGTLAPEEVVEQITAINKNCASGTTPPCGLWSIDATSQRTLTAKEIPFFKAKFPGRFPGAQTTIQRWYADPLLDNAGKDRTMRTVFTHDHFGPSTHQQAGLYAGLLIEPTCSDWRDPLNNTLFGGRFDGGPTSWQAIITQRSGAGCPQDPVPSYREFALEFQDRQLAYKAASLGKPVKYTRYPSIAPPGAAWGWVDFAHAVKPPAVPRLVTQTVGEATFSVNYANEPLAYRLSPVGSLPNTNNGGTPCPLDPQKTYLDLAHVFRSICRFDPNMNVQPTTGTPINLPGGFKFAPPFPGALPTDPYTPLLRAYEGERVQIRTLVGAHMEPHSLNLQGLKWQFEPSSSNSGFRATQGTGISEHYEMEFRLPATSAAAADGSQIKQADYLYEVSSSTTGLDHGNWGLLRAYKEPQSDLLPVPGTAAAISSACPAAAPVRHYDVSAVFARNVLDGPLVYNARGAAKTPGQFQIVDWNAMMYVRTQDLDANGKLKSNVPREPLVLRAAAGDCIEITLENLVPASGNINVGAPDGVVPSINTTAVTLNTSRNVGLRPQMVSYDVTTDDGVNVGVNPVQSVVPPAGGVVSKKTVHWYAGGITADGGTPKAIEFGAIGLAPADPLMQHNYGMLGALVIEPGGSTWTDDSNSHASATVTPTDGKKFREFVAIVQDDVAALRFTYPVAIDAAVGQNGPRWQLNGQPLPNNSSVIVVPGDSVVFSVKSGFHGITFMDKDQALASLDFGSFASAFKAQPGVGPKAWGTDGETASAKLATLLAALQVKPTTSANRTITSLAFQCTIHKTNMAGVLTITRGPVPTATAIMVPPYTLPSFPTWTRAINYRTEPLPYRYQDNNWLDSTAGIADALSNVLVSADPETPVFSAPAGMPVRVRMVHPGGNAEQVVTLHGHNWQEEPYTNDSQVIGTNPKSQSTGSRDTFGPNAAFDMVLPSAGGSFAVPGDYLLRTFIATDFQFGMWGLLRVGAAAAGTGAGRDTLVITRFEPVGANRIMITGVNTVNPINGQMAKTVSVFSGDDVTGQKLGDAPVDPLRGTWSLQAASAADRITVTSEQNGIVHSGAVAPVAISTRAITVQGVPEPVSAGSPDERDPVRNDFRPAPRKQPGTGAPRDAKAPPPPTRRPQQ